MSIKSPHIHAGWSLPGASPTQEMRPDADGAGLRDPLNRAYRLSAANQVHAAGDLIFDLVQGLLKDGDFPACDRLLAMVDLAQLVPALRITFLTTTFTARDKLPARQEYYSRVLASLIEERGEERATRLLAKYR